MAKKNYKVCMKRASSFTIYGEVEYLLSDHWTTVQLEEENPSDGLVKYYAKSNLMKQLAKEYLGSVNCWRRIYVDNSDLEIIRE